jgi:hypothetical protein
MSETERDRDRSEKIRERAYQMWEEEGRPHGREGVHWQRAADEFDNAEGERSQHETPLDPPVASKEPKKAPRRTTRPRKGTG